MVVLTLLLDLSSNNPQKHLLKKRPHGNRRLLELHPMWYQATKIEVLGSSSDNKMATGVTLFLFQVKNCQVAIVQT